MTLTNVSRNQQQLMKVQRICKSSLNEIFRGFLNEVSGNFKINYLKILKQVYPRVLNFTRVWIFFNTWKGEIRKLATSENWVRYATVVRVVPIHSPTFRRWFSSRNFCIESVLEASSCSWHQFTDIWSGGGQKQKYLKKKIFVRGFCWF